MQIESRGFIFDDAPTPSCHASTVLPLADGTALAAWFGGTAEGRDDVDIFAARCVGGVWQPPQRITADPRLPHWNPVLFRKADGSVILFFKVGKKIAYWQTYFALSRDGGLTWTAPQPLVPGDTSGGRGPVKNKPIRLADGTVIAPASTEQPDWVAFADISHDDCATWEKHSLIPVRKISGGKGVPMIQPTLWQSPDGNVHALLRTSRGHAYRSDSTDGGRTWSLARPTGIKNPNSGLDLAQTADGRLFLVSNPCARNWGCRAPLTLSVSEDGGGSWQTAMTLETRQSPDDEFSYPAIVAAGDRLYITYTWQRRKIAYVVIRL
ncbi:MAG: exo-alpha-sialidase [Clostridia bacterium]|nr:exo-alpha-sialidase [Clostridia bacterium]